MQARLLRTSVFRLTLVLIAVFSMTASLAFGFIYWSTMNQLESQVDSRLRLETDVLSNLYREGALPELVSAINKRSSIDDYGRFYFLSETNPELNGYGQEWPQRLRSIRTHSTMRVKDIAHVSEDNPQANLPVRVAEVELPGGLKMVIGHEIGDEQALLNHLVYWISGALLATLLLAVIGGIWIARSVLRRVDSITRTAGNIMTGDLSQRIPVTRDRDEFDELSNKLNQMLDRIEELMHDIQQVTDNIAHDLRSPLNRMRNRLEVILLEDRDKEEYEVTLTQTMKDADSLINTFNALLNIARLEAGLNKVDWSYFPLQDIAIDLAELYEAVAEDQGIDFTHTINGSSYVNGNRHQLAQAITNLLDNAIKYGGPNCAVHLETFDDDEHTFVQIRDTGPGIPAAKREQVLKRFVRLEMERNTPGNGLGLSLVKAIARIHSAELSLGDNKPGLIVTLKLPLAESPIESTATTP